MISTEELRFSLYTRNLDGVHDRLPSQGWITGSVRDLAMLVHRAAVPPPRGLAGKPLAGFCTTPSRRITVVYGVIVYAIRFKNPSLHR